MKSLNARGLFRPNQRRSTQMTDKSFIKAFEAKIVMNFKWFCKTVSNFADFGKQT